MTEHDTHTAWFKLLVAWLGLFLGGITLSQVALVCTVVFTVLQTFFLIRDKWWRERK